MDFDLTAEQKERKSAFRHFSRAVIAPNANRYDAEEATPGNLIRRIAEEGYLGSIIPEQWCGMGLDMLTYGLLIEEIGWACSSIRSLLTVHDMVAMAILKCGSQTQQETWLPKLARGEVLGGFAISEPNVGSDVKSVETIATRVNGGFRLNGEKKWITYGQIADVFLILGQLEGRPTSFLVERERQGFSSSPIHGMLGEKASMLASIRLDNCEIPGENLLGRVGRGMLPAILVALGLGRYSVAWGSVGLAQACVDACIQYTSVRKQSGVLLRQHQLIQAMMADMITNTKAARLLCAQAGYLKQRGDRREVLETFVAKYFASRAAMRAAMDAVQIHGAAGCSTEHSVQRYFRDAKIMEIIEGTNQIQQITIAGYGYQESAQLADQQSEAST